MARRRSVKACTECKQVKLRCDASESYPQPCARCARRNLMCVIDSGFKRTPARLRLQNVTDELRRLKQSLNASNNAIGNDQGQAVDNTPSSADSHLEGLRHQSPNGKSSLGSAFGLSEDANNLSNVQEASLGSCHFQAHEIRDLFSLFHVAFHPHFPIVDTKTSPQVMQENSPFLFWTILFTAGRHHKEYVIKANELTTSYTNLLGQTILRMPLSLHTIQAILIMCLWPLPVMYQPEDPSLLYSTMAIQASYFLGLQRPRSRSRSLGALPPDDDQTISRTWLGCFAIHTALSVAYGSPPLVKSAIELGAIDAILQNFHAPPKLAFEAEIQRCIARYHDSLIGEAEGCVRETLVQLCEQELNSVIDRYRNSMDAPFTLYFHTTQLHLYTLALLREKQQTGDMSYLDLGRGTRYQKLGMVAAHRLVDIYCDEITPPDTRLIDVYRALPKQFFVGVLLATFYLLRYFVLNPACDAEQKAACRNKVLKVHAKLRDYTSHQFAEPGRAAAVIEVLCRHGQMQDSDANAGIDDRGVASISWSALIAASNLRGMRSLKTFWLEKINPSSPGIQSHQQQSNMPDVFEGIQPLEPFEHGFPLPESVWDQSFLQMLDFSANYDIDGTTTQ